MEGGVRDGSTVAALPVLGDTVAVSAGWDGCATAAQAELDFLSVVLVR